MRIRKTLAKALGYASPPFPPPSETPTSFSSPDTSVAGSSGLICQLNKSPWDVYPNHRFVRSSFKCFEGVKSPQHPKEKQEDKSGEISEYEKVNDLGKIIPTKEMSEEKPLVGKRVNAESKKGKKKQVKKESDEIIPCKKNDGRNWFCKRTAKLPYNLCEHHLAQSRSYKEISSGSGVGCKTKKQKETGEFINSDYYYYGTVMPSRGKRRCARNVDDGSTSTAMDVKEDKMDKKNVLDGDNQDGVELQDHTAVSGTNSEEQVKIGSKRARKLVKYRSLDTLPETEP